MAFGKRVTSPPSTHVEGNSKSESSPKQDEKSENEFSPKRHELSGEDNLKGGIPWSASADGIACSVAVVTLNLKIKSRLTENGHVQAETLLVTAGAIAGYCARCAMEDLIRKGEVIEGRDYRYIKTPDGGRYLSGDKLNNFLASSVRLNLWSALVDAVAKITGSDAQLPNINSLFQRVANSLGTHDFGLLPEATRRLTPLQPLQTLNLTWPTAKKCLTGESTNSKRLPVHYWPMISDVVVLNFMRDTSSVLDPRVGALLAMELAIITSKIDPSTVLEGRL